MSSMLKNSVRLWGRLGSDPEIRETQEGKKWAKASLATSDFHTSEGGQKEQETLWHNLVMFGKTAEVAERYLSKGQELVLEGKLSYRKYTDKEGNERTTTEIIVNHILMVGAKKTEPAQV